MIFHQCKTYKFENVTFSFIFSSLLKLYCDLNLESIKKANIFPMKKSYLELYTHLFYYYCLLLLITVFTVVKQFIINKGFNLAWMV